MAIVRVNHTKNYTVMSNYHLRDKGLSLKSKGLLSVMLSLPDDWDYTTDGLVRICKEGGDAISSALRELEANGYLIRSRIRFPNGQYGEIEYTVHEIPQSRIVASSQPETDFPVMGNPEQDNPIRENPTLLNTYIQNTDLPNTDERAFENGGTTKYNDRIADNPRTMDGQLEDNVLKKSSRFVKPTVEEVAQYCKERGNGINAQYFIDFYDSKGWTIGKSKMKDWKAAVRTWESRDKKDNANRNNVSDMRRIIPNSEDYTKGVPDLDDPDSPWHV